MNLKNVYSSVDLRDAVLGEIFAGCFENEIDVASFVGDLDAFAEQHSFKKIHYRIFLFCVDEEFKKDLAKFMQEHVKGGSCYSVFWSNRIVKKMKVLKAANDDGCFGCKLEHEDPVDCETCRKCLVLATNLMENEYETVDKKVMDQGENNGHVDES